MKILFTGGGTGGHFYPIISVAQEIQKLAREKRLIQPTLFYMSDSPFDGAMLYDNDIIFKKNFAGKKRLYRSPKNFFDAIKTGWGIITALWKVFSIYPDVVFSKGGYASFPVLVAARFFRIPVIIHESDTVPGRVNRYAGKFAQKIAVSYPEAVKFFPEEKTAVTGNPVRTEIAQPLKEGAYEFLKLEKGIPTILIIGGSLGAQTINEVVIDALPELVKKYQIIHQTGKNNFQDVSGRSEAVLFNDQNQSRYKAFDYLGETAVRMAAGISSLVISRAGSAIFEIASWGLPSIIIPITESHGDHQRKNAYAYARNRACVVLEESNLTSHIIVSEIDRLLGDEQETRKMAEAAKNFFKPDASRTIAQEVLSIALRHEI